MHRSSILISINVELPGKSARGLAHSKTLSRVEERQASRQVLECGGPPPLFSSRPIFANWDAPLRCYQLPTIRKSGTLR
jgi:hypothetical protein